MNLRVNIKMKEPRFKGDQPRYHAVVSGPRETMEPRLCRFLELQGLSPYKEEDGHLIWSSPPAIGGPPVYLVPLLRMRFGVGSTRQARDMAEGAFGGRLPEDGLERFIGMRDGVKPGNAALSVIAAREDFVANCEADHPVRIQALEAAGWLPIENPPPGLAEKLGTRPYRTRDPFMAGNLEAFMTEKAREKLKELTRSAAANIKISKSQEAPTDFDVPVPGELDYLPFQKGGIQQISRSGKSGIIADDMGLGKAQPLDARVLTPDGWRKMGEIRVGDLVIGSDGRSTRVTGVYPQGEREVFRVTFSDGATTECCDEHLWTGSPLSSAGEEPPVTLALKDIRVGQGSGSVFRIPLVTAVNFTNKGPALLDQDQLAPRPAQRAEQLVRLVADRSERTQEGQLLAFLSGDAEVALIQSLVWSLGGTAHRDAETSGKTRIRIHLPKEIDPDSAGAPERLLTEVRPAGVKPVQCIAVDAPDHLYVTDDYIVTHNTIQGIGLMNAKPHALNVLVVCQANMKIKWTREIDKWMVNRGLSVGYAEGSEFPETNVVVINYDILQKNIEKLRGRNWDLILTDEAHNLKNEEAQRTKAVLGDLLDLNGERMLPMADRGQLVHLTGTPKPNRVSELWPLLTSSRPDLWGRGPKAREIFLNRYQPPVLIKKKMRRGNREVEMIIPMDGKPTRETELQLRLRGSGSFIRRLKRDTDLPPKFRTPLEIPVRLSKEDKALLREAEADLEQLVRRVSGADVRVGESREAGVVISAISLIDPDTPSFNELARVRRNLGLVKAPHCAKFILDELEDEKDMAPENRTKTVVFAHHKEVIRIIHEEAEKREPGSFLVYDGSVKASDRQPIIDRFQTDESVRGIIISLAGATGITLTAAARMRVVEPDWTPSNMTQIEDRIWRIGQEGNVDIGYLSVAGTLDARIGNALVEKMESDERAINTIRFRHQIPVVVAPARTAVAPLEHDQNSSQPELPL